MGRARVIGQRNEETAAARAATWRRVAALIDRAAGTPRVLAQEPDDAQLEAMAAGCRVELERLEAAVGPIGPKPDTEPEPRRDLIEPTTTTIGPRQWLQPDGQFR